MTRTVRRVEELLGHGSPAVEAEVGDLEDTVRRREALLELREDGRVDRAIAVLRPDRLRRRGPQVVDERLRLRRVLRRARDRDRVLDQQRVARPDHLDRVARGDRRQPLALVADQDVALAREEGVEGVTAALVLRDDVLVVASSGTPAPAPASSSARAPDRRRPSHPSALHPS